MKTIPYTEVVTETLAQDAILNTEYHGFKEDYLALHCLMRRYWPLSIFEIGTNEGRGITIMRRAVPDAKIYSLDLPDDLHHLTKQHPISEGKGSRVGHLAHGMYTQLRGDSMDFDYLAYPCEAYFIDGEHDFDHPFYETSQVLRCSPKLIVWHDADIPCVADAITQACKMYNGYQLYRVEGTRIAYAVKVKL